MIAGTTFKSFLQGEIVLLPYPFGDLSGTKKRPAIVISNKTVNSKTQDLILAQITHNLRNDEFSFTLKNEDLDKPLKYQSEIRCHKIFTADKSIIIDRISSLKASKISTILEKIATFIS